MSYDSQINEYRKKMRNIDAAKPNVKAAIDNYNEAKEELNKVKGFARCEDIKGKISSKITDLEALINKMKSDYESYEEKIRYLKRKKAEAERAAKEEVK